MDRWLVFCAWLRLVVIASAVGAAASRAGEVLIGGAARRAPAQMARHKPRSRWSCGW